MVEHELEKPENKKLLASLYAFSRDFYKRFYKSEFNHKNKGFKDYVQDALEKHLRGKDNFDPLKGKLDYHLKYNVIRQMIVNDLPLEVRKSYEQSRKSTSPDEGMIHIIQEVHAYIDPEDLPFVDFGLENMDSPVIFKAIEEEIKGKEVEEKIYLAIVQDKYQFPERQEICAEYEIEPADFDLGKKRFLTVVRRVFKKFDII